MVTPRSMLSVFGTARKLGPPFVRPQKTARFFARSPRTEKKNSSRFCGYLGCAHRVRVRSWRVVAPGGVVFPRFFEVALMDATAFRSRACVFKFPACDALSRPIVAHMLRWEGSRLVSHGGVCNFGEVCNIRSTFPIKKFDFYLRAQRTRLP